MIKKLILYHFTGTGNALSVANWIAQVAKTKELEVEIHRITPSFEVKSPDIDNQVLLGFCYPTHGFNAPPVVIDFFIRFPSGKNNVFFLNTRAGMKISKLFTPGLSGMAQLAPSFILWFKGYKTVGFQPMDLPSNWISIHPGLRKQVIESIFLRCEKITKRFADKILSGKKVYKGLISLPFDILVSPISFLYYFYGRISLSKTFIANYKCNGCELCAIECPVSAIQMKGNRPFWSRKCESCMHCMNRCPKRAIETPHLFVFIVWWVIFAVIPVLILKWIASRYPEIESWSGLASDIIMFVTGLPVVFFTYRILHFLMKYKFVNWFITNTSLTRLWFWRRYIAPSKYQKSE